ncbi:hypothetical protein EXIGLDRAFT_843706 [Exidia glandulosa HHB12029]|uniref:Trafficking protein particle complex subunit 11 n=1 Tax=Exidia glandulosa HHB12029 TaxID=1314781 RepID=A0A165CH34_EXIGL|nr:hypothetical protein EXIGLDRAFT_843706 [Exidia glandulosa HHB12029]
MNSYPVELLAQPCPVMFVAGLEAAPPPTPPVQTPGSGAAPTPTSAGSPGHPRVQSLSTTHQDPFVVLQQRLRDALTQTPKNAIWLADRGKTFQVHLVDKNVRFPPRKIFPPTPANRLEEALSASTTARSPLSPLMPSSPLHPDGLIAPIWMRKHLDLVPSVFVLFLRLWELPAPKSPLEGHDNQDREEERRHDMDLATEIANRKKSALERGIKLTVVLIASRRMLDDPNLDSRLTFIRRQSALDSRAALFVLSPVSSAELADFVRSLQDALYESAMEYYSAHSKRVRRKRNRHATPASTAPIPPVLSANPKPMPLRPAGWAVRYEYKLATFAEFRAEEEVARKHYEDCWIQLVDMFSSTGILPPRTKRWAEAKVLVDCISVKICKLYLYHGEHARALAHVNRHVQRFAELSRAWGIGEETFEFWSWLARQQRWLGELLEHGLRGSLKIPSHMPHEPVNPALAAQLAAAGGLAPGSKGASLDLGTALQLGIGVAPASALQHPGYYYFAAAKYTQMRFDRFLKALDLEATQPSALSATPGFMNEKKIDHQALVLELYTRAYDLFKKFSPTASRLTLYIAYHIALAYHNGGKFDLAVRFFERIAKTYRREQWGMLLNPILRTWYASARQMHEVEPAVRLLFEMLAHGVNPQDGTNAAEELVELLKSTSPDKDESLVLDMADARPLGDWTPIFWSNSVFVNEPAPFQLHLQARHGVPFSELPVSALLLFIGSSETPSIVVQHAAGEKTPPVGDVSQVDVGQFSLEDAAKEPVTVSADLRAPSAPGRLVVCGAVSSALPGRLEISKAVLCLQEGSWKIEVPIDVGHRDLAAAPTSLVWLSSPGSPPTFVAVHRQDHGVTTVKHPPHSVAVTLNHNSPAYLDEAYPIHIDIVNDDQRTLAIHVDVLLQPMEHGAEDEIRLGDQKSSALLKGVPCGILGPGEKMRHTLTLSSTRAGGDRVLDISVQSRAVTGDEEEIVAAEADGDESLRLEDHEGAKADTNEMLHTLVVPTIPPFDCSWTVSYARPLQSMREPADMAAYEPDAFESDVAANLMLTCTVPGPWDVELKSVQLDHSNLGSSRAQSCSSELDDFPFVLQSGDSYSATVSMALSRLLQGGPEPPLGAVRCSWRRASSDDVSATSSTLIPLPFLNPPGDDLVAFVDPPSTAHLHVPFTLRLVVQNRHHSRTADLALQLEPSDNFVVSGMRSGRVPLLIAGAQDEMLFNFIPLACGVLKLPTLKLLDKRSAVPAAATDPYGDGRSGSPAPNGQPEADLVPVPVRDARFDVQFESGDEVYGIAERMTILVLP